MGKLRFVEKQFVDCQSEGGFPVFKTKSGKGDEFYYITVFPNPSAGKKLYTCTCPDFTLGRPRKGINPYASPCKHIVMFKEARDKEE